mmetsp:Transcript_31095/g.43266  ORF Transcript_31095/g.43266 Transcript_31095/m.43266 type:complete len:103 (+) Transcript_31095:1-309(+)
MTSSASRLFDSIKHSNESPPLKGGGGGRFQDHMSHRINVDGGPHPAHPSLKNNINSPPPKDDERGKAGGRDFDKDEGRNADTEDMAEEFSELGFSIDYTDPV